MYQEDEHLEAAYEDRFLFDDIDDESIPSPWVSCSHQWVAGMCYVSDEDLASVVESRNAIGQTVECEHCEAQPIEGIDF